MIFFKSKPKQIENPWPLWLKRYDSRGNEESTYAELTKEGGLILYDKEGKRHRVITVPLD